MGPVHSPLPQPPLQTGVSQELPVYPESQEHVPELQEPITEADAVQVVRDLVRRRGFDGPVTSSEMYAIEASGEDLVFAVVAPWEPGTAEPIGAYFEFTGSVLTKSDACTSFLHGSPAE